MPDTTRRLYLCHNNITYQPRQFERFKDLTYLDLSYNYDFIPGNDSFSGLKHLRTLYLDFIDLQLFQTSLFTEPSNLETLSLRATHITYIAVRLLKNLPSLDYLDLSWNALTDIASSTFTSLPNLQYLCLRGNRIIFNNRTFSGLPNLKSLDLSFCFLTSAEFPQNILDELGNLTELDISYNHLSAIQSNVFSSLTKLTHLDLSFSKELTLFSQSFAGLSQLTFLSLASSKIRNATSFPEDVFQPLRNLEHLHLEGLCNLTDRYYHCEDIDKRLSNLPSLKRLYLDNCVIESLGPGFSSLKNLEALIFKGKRYDIYQIGILSNETFKNLKDSSISTLILERLQIDNLLPHSFSNFKNLNSLEMTSLELPGWCNQDTLNIETGLQDTKVTRLQLQLQCRTTVLYLYRTISSLRGLMEIPLEKLNLSFGSIAKIHFSFFESLPVSLKYLYLHQNYISSIEFGYRFNLLRLKNLVHLDLSHQKRDNLYTNNSVQVHHYSEMNKTTRDSVKRKSKFNSSAVSVKLSESYVVQQKYSVQETGTYCFELPPSLETLDISNSGLLCDIEQILCDPDNSLKTLNIADQYDPYTCLEKIWKRLNHLPKLQHLDLRGNHIKSIPTGTFSNLINLKKLFLSHNALGPVLSFDLQTLVLQILNFSDNSIGYMSEDFTKHLDKIAERSKLVVDLRDNSLLCNCERIDFISWMRYTKVMYQRNSLTCESKTDKKYKVGKIAELHESLKYECTVKEVTAGCIVLFVGLILILFIGYLMWYKRWKLRYLLALGRKTVNPYHPIEECEVELEYDVYISYERDHGLTPNQTLHELVSQVVYPAIRRRGYRVLIREELEAGVGLYHSISYALRRSKKVVALISRDYCTDYWNVFEFNMAVLEGIYTKRQVLIPVAFEQIGREDLHAEIYAFLSAGSVAYHTVNVTDEMFVDYLCDKIRDNREFGE